MGWWARPFARSSVPPKSAAKCRTPEGNDKHRPKIDGCSGRPSPIRPSLTACPLTHHHLHGLKTVYCGRSGPGSVTPAPGTGFLAPGAPFPSPGGDWPPPGRTPPPGRKTPPYGPVAKECSVSLADARLRCDLELRRLDPSWRCIRAAKVCGWPLWRPPLGGCCPPRPPALFWGASAPRPLAGRLPPTRHRGNQY